MNKTWMIVFEGVKSEENKKTFDSKFAAMQFKSEHPLGKFAAIVPCGGTWNE